MNPATDSIEVAAGIAVQSQWYSPLDTRMLAPNGSNSGLGIAQVSDPQMVEYGLAGLDQTNPAIAVKAMQARIGLVQDACIGCSVRDKLIVAALTQNGSGFIVDSMRDVMDRFMECGNIDWAGYFKTWTNPKTDPSAWLRERATGHQYDTEFMLLLFTNDLRELNRRGWDLPAGITEADLDYLEDLANGGN
jgi:hypothetical protein